MLATKSQTLRKTNAKERKINEAFAVQYDKCWKKLSIGGYAGDTFDVEDGLPERHQS